MDIVFLVVVLFFAIAPFINWRRIIRRVQMRMTNSHAYRRD